MIIIFNLIKYLDVVAMKVLIYFENTVNKYQICLISLLSSHYSFIVLPVFSVLIPFPCFTPKFQFP